MLARSYSAAAVATPMGASVLVALTVTDASLGQYLVAATPLSLLLVFFSVMGLSSISQINRPKGDDTVLTPVLRATRLLLLGLCAGLLLVIGLVIVLDLPVLPGFAAGILVNSVVWGALGWHLRAGSVPSLRIQVLKNVRQVADGSILLLAGSFLGTALAKTTAMTELANRIEELGSTLAGVVLTLLAVVALRLVGLPPPAIVLVAGPVLSGSVNLSPPSMAVLLVTSAMLATLVAPNSLTTAMVSSFAGWSPIEVSMGRQITFVGVGSIAAVIYILILA